MQLDARYASRLVGLGVVALALLFIGRSAVPTNAEGEPCADFDGDGVVHLVDLVMVGSRWGTHLNDPGYDPRLDVYPALALKEHGDGVIDIRDVQYVYGRLDLPFSCQTDPLAKTSLAGGALALDADGETVTAGDPVEAERVAIVGVPFHVSVQLATNPGVAAYQVQLRWDESLLDLNPRTASANDAWQENNPQPPLVVAQHLGPADDGVGSDAFIELAGFGLSPAVSTYLGPIAQFEFTCQAEGTANVTLAAGGHSVLAAAPSTEYVPTLTNAAVHCLTDPAQDSDSDGCTDLREFGSDPMQGGQRDPANPWDYFNPTHDGQNRIDDILLVVQAYFKDDNDGNPGLPPYAPGYNPDMDRTRLGPNAWNLGPPNGQQRVDDILNSVYQYHHDCA